MDFVIDPVVVSPDRFNDIQFQGLNPAIDGPPAIDRPAGPRAALKRRSLSTPSRDLLECIFCSAVRFPLLVGSLQRRLSHTCLSKCDSALSPELRVLKVSIDISVATISKVMKSADDMLVYSFNKIA